MKRAYYGDSFERFAALTDAAILGELTQAHGHALEPKQRNAWLAQIRHLKETLETWPDGHILIEFVIPRMGKRADVVILLRGVVFVIEYKVGAEDYASHAVAQVVDYALDLKNFHGGTHDLPVAPVLVATNAVDQVISPRWQPDGLAVPALANRNTLGTVLADFTREARPTIDVVEWLNSPYKPTPTIVEAARGCWSSVFVVCQGTP